MKKDEKRKRYKNKNRKTSNEKREEQKEEQNTINMSHTFALLFLFFEILPFLHPSYK